MFTIIRRSKCSYIYIHLLLHKIFHRGKTIFLFVYYSKFLSNMTTSVIFLASQHYRYFLYITLITPQQDFLDPTVMQYCLQFYQIYYIVRSFQYSSFLHAAGSLEICLAQPHCKTFSNILSCMALQIPDCAKRFYLPRCRPAIRYCIKTVGAPFVILFKHRNIYS